MFSARRGSLASAIRRASATPELNYIPDPFIDDVVMLVDTYTTPGVVFAQTVNNKVGRLSIATESAGGGGPFAAALPGIETSTPVEGLTRMLSNEDTLTNLSIPQRHWEQAFDLSGEFTVEGWLRGVSTGTASAERWFIQGSSGAGGLSISYVSPDWIVRMSTAEGVYDLVLTGGSLSFSDFNNNWNFIAVTKDAAGTVRLYVNGSLAASADFSTAYQPSGDALGSARRVTFLAGSGGVETSKMRCLMFRITQRCRYTDATCPVPTKVWQSHTESAGDPLLHRTAYLWQYAATRWESSTRRNGGVRGGGDIGFSSSSTAFDAGVDVVQEEGPFPFTHAVSIAATDAVEGLGGPFASSGVAEVKNFTAECMFKSLPGTATARSGYGLNFGRNGTGSQTGPCGVQILIDQPSAGTDRLTLTRFNAAGGFNNDSFDVVGGIGTDDWHHLVLQKEGNVFSLYYDGVRVVQVTDSDFRPWIPGTTHIAFWGRDSTNGNAPARVSMWRLTAGARYSGPSCPVPTEAWPRIQQGYIDYQADPAPILAAATA